MLFSIILPIYNGRKYLRRALDSVVSQYLNSMIELIIVDDHSTEEYEDIIDEYRDTLNIIFLNNNGLQGPGPARNVGIKRASGEWICFLDADDELVTGSLAQILNQLQFLENNEQVIMTTAHHIVDNSYEGNLPYNWVWINAKFYRRTFLQDNHIYFHETVLGIEDAYFNNLVRCYLIYYKADFKYIPELVTYKYHYTKESLTNQLYDTDYGKVEFQIYYFDDFMYTHIQICADFIDSHPDLDYDQYYNIIDIMVSGFIYGYLTIQQAEFFKQNYKYSENIFIYYRDLIEDRLDCTILDYAIEFPALYSEAKTGVTTSLGNFIETESIFDFYKKLPRRKQ